MDSATAPPDSGSSSAIVNAAGRRSFGPAPALTRGAQRVAADSSARNPPPVDSHIVQR